MSTNNSSDLLAESTLYLLNQLSVTVLFLLNSCKTKYSYILEKRPFFVSVSLRSLLIDFLQVPVGCVLIHFGMQIYSFVSLCVS